MKIYESYLLLHETPIHNPYFVPMHYRGGMFWCEEALKTVVTFVDGGFQTYWLRIFLIIIKLIPKIQVGVISYISISNLRFKEEK